MELGWDKFVEQDFMQFATNELWRVTMGHCLRYCGKFQVPEVYYFITNIHQNLGFGGLKLVHEITLINELTMM